VPPYPNLHEARPDQVKKAGKKRKMRSRSTARPDRAAFFATTKKSLKHSSQAVGTN